MAIKGKRKSQKKTKPSRPRPVSAARAPRSAAPQQPFHRTFEGQLAAIVVALVVAGFAMFTIAADRADDAEQAGKADGFEAYTSEVEGLLTPVNQTVREMSGAPFNAEDTAGIAALEDRAKEWVQDLEGAGALASAVVAPPELASVNRILTQAFRIYSSAAKTYGLVPDAEGKLQKDLIDRASEQRTIANEVMISAISALDLARADVGMGPSDLQAPGTLPPIAATPAATPSPNADDSGKGGKKGDG